MRIDDALLGVSKIFLDTAPVIYYVEQHPKYFAVINEIFDHIDKGTLRAILSPVTLAECLVVPFRTGNTSLQQDFVDLATRGTNTDIISIDHATGKYAAELRAHYNLGLLDALQIAMSLTSGCDALLTNDRALRSVTEVRIVVVEDFV